MSHRCHISWKYSVLCNTAEEYFIAILSILICEILVCYIVAHCTYFYMTRLYIFASICSSMVFYLVAALSLSSYSPAAADWGVSHYILHICSLYFLLLLFLFTNTAFRISSYCSLYFLILLFTFLSTAPTISYFLLSILFKLSKKFKLAKMGIHDNEIYCNVHGCFVLDTILMHYDSFPTFRWTHPQ